jgi:hypothetical protein
MALANPVYVVRDLVKTYKSGKVRANDGLSFDTSPSAPPPDHNGRGSFGTLS